MFTSTYDKLNIELPAQADRQWKYLVIEKRLSTNWISKLLKGSLINSFWSVFTSHIS